MIQKAIKFAVDAHSKQFRKRTSNGVELPYIVHPMEVFKLLWSWGIINNNISISAILHDVVEDTEVKLEEIKVIFGEKVSKIIDELTFLGDAKEKENYLKSFESKSIESLAIKIADRICNVKDFDIFDPNYARKYARKAEYLFSIFRDRICELEEEFGEINIGKMVNDVNIFCNKYLME